MPTMGRMIAGARITAGMTQEELAEAVCNSRRQAMVTHKHFSLPALPALELIWQATSDLLTQGDWQSALSAVCRAGACTPPAVDVLPLSQASSARERGPGGEDAVRLAELARARTQNMTALHRGLLTMADVERLNAPLMAEERKLRLTGARSSRSAPTLDLAALVGQSAQDLMLALRASDLETQLSVLLSLWEPAQVYPGRLLILTSQLPDLPPISLTLPPRQRNPGD